MNQFQKTIELVDNGVKSGIFPCASFAAGSADKTFIKYFAGNASLYPVRPVNQDTLFDLASITKVMSTTMIAIKFLDKGLIDLSDRISHYFDVPEDKSEITVRHLMTHTSGLKADIRLENVCSAPTEACAAILKSPLVLVPGKDVIYSCLGYILLGHILELVGQKPLNLLFEEFVSVPLGLKHAGFCPNCENMASTEYDSETGTYLCGVVHDENARFLNGVSGNAGLFAPIDDCITFVQAIMSNRSNPTLATATSNLTAGMSENRGLGFQINTPGCSAGTLMSSTAFGHTGFTGTSFWIDPIHDFYVILLTNRVHPTRENTNIISFRKLFHDSILNYTYIGHN